MENSWRIRGEFLGNFNEDFFEDFNEDLWEELAKNFEDQNRNLSRSFHLVILSGPKFICLKGQAPFRFGGENLGDDGPNDETALKRESK